MNSFNNKWKQAEKEFAKYFNGVLVTEKKQQYADIDVRLRKRGNTVSIKDIGESSKTYGGALFETRLYSTVKKKSMKGSFYKCKATVYAIRLWYKGEMCWYVASTANIKAYLESGSFRTITTKSSTEAKNRASGRVYDGSECVCVDVEDLIANTNNLTIPIRKLKSGEAVATLTKNKFI